VGVPDTTPAADTARPVGGDPAPANNENE